MVALDRLRNTGAVTQHKAEHHVLGLFILSAGTFLQLYTHFSTIYKKRIIPHLQKDKRHSIAISIYQLDPIQ